MSPGRRQAITWTNERVLLIWPLRTNFSEILIEMHAFSFKKMHLKMSYWKRRSSRLVISVLNTSIYFLVPCLLLPCSLLVAVINRIPSSKIRIGLNKFVATIFYIGKRVWYAKSYPVINLRHWRYRNGLFPSVGTKLYSRDCNLQKACVNYAWSPRLHVESKWKTRSHVCPIKQISNVHNTKWYMYYIV